MNKMKKKEIKGKMYYFDKEINYLDGDILDVLMGLGVKSLSSCLLSRLLSCHPFPRVCSKEKKK